jgi:hypothetical protein
MAEPAAERLVGSIRRECLDPIVVFGDAHLRRILAVYAAYYNDVRTHLASPKAHRSVVLFSGSARSLCDQSSPAFIINIAGSNFR